MKKDLFHDIIGHEAQKNFFRFNILNGSIKHFYIFLGCRQLGKSTFAANIAQYYLCENREKAPCNFCNSCRSIKTDSHPDFIVITKEQNKKNISIEQVRKLKNSIKYKPYYLSKRIILIKNAENASLEAYNALLKTLEEPGNQNLIFITLSFLGFIPKTVLSRAQIIKFYPVSRQAIYEHLADKLDIARSLSEKISSISFGKPGLALDYAREPSLLNKKLSEIKAYSNLLSSSLFQGVEGLSQVKNIEDRLLNQIEILRDALLSSYGMPDQLFFKENINELDSINGKINITGLLNGSLELYLLNQKINVNGQLALENNYLKNYISYEK